MKYVHDYYVESEKEHYLLGDNDDDDDVEGGIDETRRTLIMAVLYLILGTLIASVFADPLVDDAVRHFSSAINIPTFFVSFIVLPFATNSSEAMTAIILASRKKQRSISITFSELYGAVTMNNILCLSVFLALVYGRGMTWDFSSKVLVILIVCLVMGIFASLHTTFSL